MKILLIDVNCKYSSTGKIVYDLFSRLNNDPSGKYEARIAYGRGDLISEKGIYKFGDDLETKKHALLARITGKNGCFSPKSTQNLINYIEEFQPDIIHIHELHAYFVNHGQLLKYLRDKQYPLIWTFHCEYMYTGKCGFAYDCRNYLSGCGNCPYIKEYVTSFGIDKSAQLLAEKKESMKGLNLKSIVTPSKWLADKTSETFLGKAGYNYPINVIHNGIDTEGIFYPRDEKSKSDLYEEYDIPEQKKLVLAVAPNIMDVRKGGQLVVDFAQKLEEKECTSSLSGENNNYFFVMVGADEAKRLSNNIQLIARTKNQDELARWYSAADVFLICSKAENFPTTCIEALCCGTPVVGINLGGTAETAKAPYGSFVEYDDNIFVSLEDALKSQLERGLSSEEIRKYAIENYDNAVMYDNYLKLYE